MVIKQEQAKFECQWAICQYLHRCKHHLGSQCVQLGGRKVPTIGPPLREDGRFNREVISYEMATK